jgi:glycosyltransferase involved in cell wall biosynthesis
MLRDGHDVHFLNVVELTQADRIARTFGSGAGNPRALPNVRTCFLEGPRNETRHEFTRLVDNVAPDAIVAHGYIAAALVAGSAPGRRLACITGSCRQARDWLETGWAWDMIGLSRLLDRRAYPPPVVEAVERTAMIGSHMVLTHSEQTQDMMQRFFPSLAHRIHPTVFSFAEWICEDADPFLPAARPFHERDIDLLFVASDWNRWEKNWPWVRTIARRRPRARVHVVGSVPEPIPGATHHGFLATRAALFELLARTRCVACPSRSDAAPGVLFEAAAMGCNVVASRNCGNWSLCHDALVADPFTVDALVACTDRAISARYDDNLDAYLARHSYDDLVATLTAFGRPFLSQPAA